MPLRSLLVISALAATVPAQLPYSFRDINGNGQGPVDPGSAFKALGTTPGNPPVFWFSAMTPDNGTELWRMQGNDQALPVGDHNPGPQGSHPVLVDPGPPAVFAMNRPDTGRELWRMSASGQLEALPEFVPGPVGILLSERVQMGGATYVVATTESGQVDLLRVAAGQVTVVSTITTSAAFGSLTVDESGLLHIGVHREPLPDEHWVSDCTLFGTRPLSESWREIELHKARGDYFLGHAGNAAGAELWKFGATGSTMVRDINPAGDSNPRDFVKLGNVTYFSADDGTTGREIWKTDGSAAGTALVADLRPGAVGSEPSSLVEVGGKLYFVADDGATGRELRSLDTAANAISTVKDIRSGSAGSGIRALFVLGSTLYFGANDGVAGNELWRSDGTTSGTTLVRDAFPGPGDANPDGFFAANGTVWLTLDDGVRGAELWKSDGTVAGTVLHQNLSPPIPATSGSDPYGFHDAGWDTIFGATDTSGTELYRMTFNGDQPVAGRIKDINPGARSSEPRNFVTLPDGRVLFSANHVAMGREIWITDGTDAGTTLVKDIRPGSQGSEPAGLLWVPGLRAVLFSADDGATGREPWFSDGTAAGTQRLADLNPGSAGSNASHFALRRDGAVFFSADDGQVGVEPWVLDPGAAQPRRYADLLSVGFGSFPRTYTFVDDGNGNEKVFFVADTTPVPYGLFVTDGTTAGTRLIRSFRHIQDSARMVGFVDARLYFVADDGISGPELWKSDGTLGGTALVIDLAAGPLGSLPDELTAMVEYPITSTSKLFFSASTHMGRELCVIGPHPTHAPTILDVNPWDGSANPRDLAVQRGPSPRLLFAADRGDGRGHEPWVTYGAHASTRRIADLNMFPGVGSDPGGLTATGYGWLFSADDGVHGREVWLMDSLRGVALSRGVGCGTSPPSLTVTPPRLGTVMRMSGRPGPSGSLGALLLNGGQPGTSFRLFGCGYNFDPLTAVIVPLPPQDSTWSLNLPLPQNPLLVDQQIESRALFISVAPFELHLSPGVLLALGQ